MASNVKARGPAAPTTQTGGTKGSALSHAELDSNFFAIDTDHGTAVANKALILDSDGDLNMNNVGRIDNCETVQFFQELANGNAGAGITITLNSAQKQSVALNAATTTLTLTAPTSVGNWLLKLINTAGSAYTVTWTPSAGALYWAGGVQPTWTQTGTDLVSIYYDGTNFYCSGMLDFS